jgi:hypothetical protein
MAVDTRSRRASVLGIALAVNLTLPLSDGTVGQPDRQHVAFCYPGILASATPSPDTIIRVRADVIGIQVREDVGTIRVRPDVGDAEP